MISALKQQLRAIAAEHGFIPLHTYMALCASVYYHNRDPLGVRGDFITAPEVSPLFGESLALQIAQHWRTHNITNGVLFEAGAGRGTLMRDIVHVLQRLGFAPPPIFFADCNQQLIAQQKQWLPQCVHVADASQVPTHAPVCVIANEFFDALPIACNAVRIVPNGDDFVLHIQAQHPIAEYSPQTTHIWQHWCAALQQAGAGSMALIADYGYITPPQRLTVRGFYRHTVCDVTHAPGDTDVTADVDFSALQHIATKHGLQVQCDTQRHMLQRFGIDALWHHYHTKNADMGQKLLSGLDMLINPQHMGERFYILQAVVV